MSHIEIFVEDWNFMLIVLLPLVLWQLKNVTQHLKQSRFLHFWCWHFCEHNICTFLYTWKFHTSFQNCNLNIRI